jgi:hypothetical protein
VKLLFRRGRVVATPGALAAIGVSGDDLSISLARHQSGDWGDMGGSMATMNVVPLIDILLVLIIIFMVITPLRRRV